MRLYTNTVKRKSNVPLLASQTMFFASVRLACDMLALYGVVKWIGGQGSARDSYKEV